MTFMLFWILVIAVASPFVIITVAYRRIIDYKIREVEDRFKAHRHFYENAYGGPNIREALSELYHPHTYIPPVALLTAITSLFSIAALLHLNISLGLSDTFETQLRRVPHFALVGAGGGYLWGLFDLLRRYRTADLPSSALHSYWLRMLTASAIGPLLASASALSAQATLGAAFAVGALPFRDVWAFARKLVNIPISGPDAEPPTLHLIEGATSAMIERLADEDIDSVQRLSFANPFRLLFRTNIEWNVILDLIDQAMLVNFVGSLVSELRPLGVRGAIEMAQLYDALGKGDPLERDCAKAVLKLIAVELNKEEAAAVNLAYQLRIDAMVQFIWKHWNSAAAPDQPHGSDGEDLSPACPGDHTEEPITALY